ncbi:MAG: hypothetical protein CML20_07955 [Rheinheimera sp.]|uniref:hypothetical protein n=1 Tax=Arsukibacterium sp. UBA3155 TaxID=1946058 RepID=UPI000C8E7D6F|nr:hypothetical protein [Arsukibacterium sp. UBA3155]MAD74708.1 hypothetical protein [Rheinheimera sp.]|tara:strand:- start:148671 stop:149729 length:1059 start_codon:yes stop_codon:yes gene_type:complete
MSVWDVLKIQQTNEIGKIKTAYAKELKNCQPDKDPEGFQVLHQAYKAALHLVQKAASEVNKNDRSQQVDSSPTGEEPAPQTPNNEIERSPEEQAYIELLNAEYNRHVERVTVILDGNNTRNDPNEWRFLFHSDFILDSQFNAHLGMFVLDKILKINNEFESLNRHNKRYSQPNSTVKGSTVKYLDGIFHWRGQIQSLRYFFGDDNTIKILNMLEGHDHSTDTQSAINSVKGGKVRENKARKVNHADQYSEAIDALQHLKKLTYWTHGIGILLLSVVMPALIEDDNIGPAMIIGSIITLLIIQIIGVTLKNKYMLYTMWPTSFFLLLCFPWGTFAGWRMSQCLYKGIKYFRYS